MFAKTSFIVLVVCLQTAFSSAKYLSCPVGWVTYKESSYCYRVGAKPTTKWAEARKACLAMGGDLVKIRSAQENKYVAILARTYFGHNGLMWLGLVRDSSQKFTWVDGTTLTNQKYSNWNSGEPNNYKGQAEDCGMLYLSHMEWNDIVCDRSNALVYLCEKDKTN